MTTRVKSILLKVEYDCFVLDYVVNRRLERVRPSSLATYTPLLLSLFSPESLVGLRPFIGKVPSNLGAAHFCFTH